MHGWILNDKHFVKLEETLAKFANDPLKLNVINTSLINQNMVLYYAFLLSIYEYW